MNIENNDCRKHGWFRNRLKIFEWENDKNKNLDPNINGEQ